MNKYFVDFRLPLVTGTGNWLLYLNHHYTEHIVRFEDEVIRVDVVPI